MRSYALPEEDANSRRFLLPAKIVQTAFVCYHETKNCRLFSAHPMSSPSIPSPDVTHTVFLDDGAEIILRRYSRASGTRLVVSHGNGCAVDGYFPYWQKFLDDHEVVVFDFRNCGQNPAHVGAHDYPIFLKDMTAVYDSIDDAFGKRSQAGAFHSMSARINLKYALEGNRRLDALVVFDPPMVPPEDHPLHELLHSEERVLWRWAAGRPAVFDDPSELADLYAKSRMLSGWVDGTYDLMARAVLRQDTADGKWHLVCSGARESNIYRQNAALNIWPHGDDFPIPVLLVGGDPESDIPSAPAHACRALGSEMGWRYESVPGTGHFLQLQEPDACAQLTKSFLIEKLG